MKKFFGRPAPLWLLVLALLVAPASAASAIIFYGDIVFPSYSTSPPATAVYCANDTNSPAGLNCNVPTGSVYGFRWLVNNSTVATLSTAGLFTPIGGISGTCSSCTLSGTTTNSGTISGGNISGATLSGLTTNSATISGGTISGATLSNSTLSGTTTGLNSGLWINNGFTVGFGSVYNSGGNEPALITGTAVDFGSSTSSPIAYGYVDTGGYHSPSLLALKKDVAPYARDPLDLLDHTDFAQFRYKSEPESAPVHFGIVADFSPSEISGPKHDNLSVNAMASIAGAGVAELNRRVQRDEAEIARLERVVARLERRR
jgi:hypothetical protein